MIFCFKFFSRLKFSIVNYLATIPSFAGVQFNNIRFIEVEEEFGIIFENLIAKHNIKSCPTWRDLFL